MSLLLGNKNSIKNDVKGSIKLKGSNKTHYYGIPKNSFWDIWHNKIKIDRNLKHYISVNSITSNRNKKKYWYVFIKKEYYDNKENEADNSEIDIINENQKSKVCPFCNAAEELSCKFCSSCGFNFEQKEEEEIKEIKSLIDLKKEELNKIENKLKEKTEYILEVKRSKFSNKFFKIIFTLICIATTIYLAYNYSNINLFTIL